MNGTGVTMIIAGIKSGLALRADNSVCTETA